MLRYFDCSNFKYKRERERHQNHKNKKLEQSIEKHAVEVKIKSTILQCSLGTIGVRSVEKNKSSIPPAHYNKVSILSALSEKTPKKIIRPRQFQICQKDKTAISKNTSQTICPKHTKKQ